MKINDWKVLKSEFGTSSKRYTSTPKKITYWQKCCYLNCKLKNENKLFALTKEASPILQSDINILMCEMDYPPPLIRKINHILHYLPPAFQIFLVYILKISLQTSSLSRCCCSTSSPTKYWIRGSLMFH